MGGKVVKNVAGFDVTRLSVGSWGSLGIITSVSARLFPIPERDLTLALLGDTATELLPLAFDAARSSLPLAAVELMDPLPAGEGEEASPALILRLMGTPAQVGEMEARIRSEIGQAWGGVWGDAWSQTGGRALRLEGEESQGFHKTVNRWEGGADLVLRLCLLPSGLGTLLGEAGELRSLLAEGADASSGMRLSAQVGTGILRVAVGKLPEDAETLATWAPALRELRARLEEKGGTLTLSSGPVGLMREVGAWGTPGGAEELMSGLKEQFDPKGILAPGRLGL